MAEEKDIITDEYLDDEEELQQNQYLTFRIASEIYGIGVLDVVEIIRMVNITNIPESLPYIKGIINLRGKIIPVADVRLRFNLDEKEYDDRTCIIVVGIRGVEIGLIVDTVAEVVEIPEDCIEKMPGVSAGQQKFVKGIGKVDDEVKVLLSLDALLAEDDIAALKKI